MIELIESILQRLQLNSTSTVVSNYHESWHGVNAGGPTYQHLDRFLPLFLSPLPSIQAYRESWHNIKSPSSRICPVPSFCGRFNFPSTISIMPSLSHDPTAIEALIISGRSRARLAVRSKPVRLNMRSGSNNIGGIVSRSSAMRASRWY